MGKPGDYTRTGIEPREGLTEEQLDGFLDDLTSDVLQYGLLESIRASAKAVMQQLVKDAGYKSPDEIPAIERAAVERVKRIALESIAAEHEYPQDMPDELWVELNGNRLNTTKAMRSTVRLTKNGITDRFLEALKSSLLGKGDKGK